MEAKTALGLMLDRAMNCRSLMATFEALKLVLGWQSVT
jgi:hypothetical protein